MKRHPQQVETKRYVDRLDLLCNGQQIPIAGDVVLDGIKFRLRKYRAAPGEPIRLTDEQLREWRREGARR